MQVSLPISWILTPGGTGGTPRRRFLLHLLRKVFEDLILAEMLTFVPFFCESATLAYSGGQGLRDVRSWPALPVWFNGMSRKYDAN